MKKLSLVFCLALLTQSVEAQPIIKVMTENYPPLNYVEEGQKAGPAIEIIDLIKDQLKDSSSISVLPWARAYKTLETEANSMLFSMTRSEQREDQFKWVGPLAVKKIGFFGREDTSIEAQSINDVRPYKIAVQLNGVGMQMLQAKGFEKLDTSTKASANLRKLEKGRVDLWYASNATVSGNCTALKMKTCPFKSILTTKTTYMYMAFNKNTADSTIQLWQKTYNRLHKEGHIQKIFTKYGLDTLYPQTLEEQK